MLGADRPLGARVAPVMKPFGAALILLAGAGPTAAGHIAVSLETETSRPRPGSRIDLALQMMPQPGWHGYWRNPGDAGAAPQVEWTVPAGVTIGPLRHPPPKRSFAGGLMSHIHEGPHALLARLRLSRGIVPGTPLSIEGRVRWLACSATLCVPEQRVLRVDLMAGNGTVTGGDRARFREMRARIPAEPPRAGLIERSRAGLRLSIAWPEGRAPAAAWFFADERGLVDHGAPQHIRAEAGRLLIELKPKAGRQIPQRIGGVIAAGDGRGVAVTARLAPARPGEH